MQVGEFLQYTEGRGVGTGRSLRAHRQRSYEMDVINRKGVGLEYQKEISPNISVSLY